MGGNLFSYALHLDPDLSLQVMDKIAREPQVPGRFQVFHVACFSKAGKAFIVFQRPALFYQRTTNCLYSAGIWFDPRADTERERAQSPASRLPESLTQCFCLFRSPKFSLATGLPGVGEGMMPDMMAFQIVLLTLFLNL